MQIKLNPIAKMLPPKQEWQSGSAFILLQCLAGNLVDSCIVQIGTVTWGSRQPVNNEHTLRQCHFIVIIIIIIINRLVTHHLSISVKRCNIHPTCHTVSAALFSGSSLLISMVVHNVHCGTKRSKPTHGNCGMLQKSVLYLILFLLYKAY